jgi:glucosamine 6-phosphate synthetase-like amidotransferase/phosphosugar isomerase protein
MVEALKRFGEEAGENSQWGIVAIDKEESDRIYTFTKGSPLLIGFNKQEDQIYVVSEQIAFQTFADCFIPTEDGEIFELPANSIP